jgi:hypothetical protein
VTRPERDDLTRAQRNLHPHKAARVAMILYNKRYAYKQRGGSMDFWDSLTEGERQTCRDLVIEILNAPAERAVR